VRARKASHSSNYSFGTADFTELI